MNCKIKKILSILLMIFLIIQMYPSYVEAADIKPSTESFNVIAYSVLEGIDDAPINSAQHFRKCCSSDYSFTSIKGDVRITSDNRIVMCHDQGFTLNSKGRITSYNPSKSTDIRKMTYSQCMSLKYAKKYNGQYVGVCDFETYIRICSESNKQAFITVRDQYITELIKSMMPIIDKYGMRSKCIINSFSLDSLRAVNAYDNRIKLSWVVEEPYFSREIVDAASKMGNCIITLYCFPSQRYGGFNTLDGKLNTISYAQEKQVPLYVAILESVSYIDQLKKYGISGAQVKSLRTSEVPVTNIDYIDVYNYEYYINKYPDIKKNLGNNRRAAFEHFIEYGMKEGRQGCKDFNVISYKNRYGDLRIAYKDNLPEYYKHYIMFGKPEGRKAVGKAAIVPVTELNGIDYSSVYNYKYYINKYPDMKRLFENDDVGALYHFVNYGMKEGRQGSSNFDVISYRNRYSDLRTAYRNNLPAYYKHYILFGYKEKRNATGCERFTPITSLNGVDYSSVYDFEYYINKYPDVRKVFINDDVGALCHFIDYGMKEGRQAKPTYYLEAYKSNYPDLRRKYGEDNKKYIMHYINFGERENRNALYTTIYQGIDYSPVFDAIYYADHNLDLKNAYGYNRMLLFKHFINYGIREGRQASGNFDVNYYKRRYKDLRNAYGGNLFKYYQHYVLFGVYEGRIAAEDSSEF